MTTTKRRERHGCIQVANQRGERLAKAKSESFVLHPPYTSLPCGAAFFLLLDTRLETAAERPWRILPPASPPPPP